MSTSKFVLRFMLVFVAFLLPAAVFAQTSNGTIAGTVTDQSGAVVPKATVKAESAALDVTRETTADAGGSVSARVRSTRNIQRDDHARASTSTGERRRGAAPRSPLLSTPS